MLKRVVLRRIIDFQLKSNEMDALNASPWRTIYMVLWRKSIQITSLELCYWCEKMKKQRVKSYKVSVTYSITANYKTRSYLAYWQAEIRLMDFKPRIRAMIVTKIHHHRSGVDGANVAHTPHLHHCHQHRQFSVVRSEYGSTPSAFSHHSQLGSG